MSNKKCVVLTGVTRGIGKSLAKWLIDHGHTVIGCGRSKEIVAKLNETICSSSDSVISVVDISCSQSVKGWAEESISKFGAPDLVINNAALSNTAKNLWEVPLDEFDKMMDVNLKGVNYVIHYFLPEMIKAQKGVIVNMSSGWGRSTSPQTAPYCCTKWGIEGLSLALAQELPPPLACIPLDPGGTINTEMLVNYFGDSAKHSRGPEQWAQSAGPFLLSLDRSCNGKQLTAP